MILVRRVIVMLCSILQRCSRPIITCSSKQCSYPNHASTHAVIRTNFALADPNGERIVELYVSGPLGSWIVCYLHWDNKSHACARRRQWCGNFPNHWWPTSIKLRLLFSPCKLCCLRNSPFLRIIYSIQAFDRYFR